jgi:hypothetical protein
MQTYTVKRVKSGKSNNNVANFDRPPRRLLLWLLLLAVLSSVVEEEVLVVDVFSGGGGLVGGGGGGVGLVLGLCRWTAAATGAYMICCCCSFDFRVFCTFGVFGAFKKSQGSSPFFSSEYSTSSGCGGRERERE